MNLMSLCQRYCSMAVARRACIFRPPLAEIQLVQRAPEYQPGETAQLALKLQEENARLRITDVAAEPHYAAFRRRNDRPGRESRHRSGLLPVRTKLRRGFGH